MSLKASPLFVLPVLAVTASATQAADMVYNEAAPEPQSVAANYVALEGGILWADQGIVDANDSDKFGNIRDDRGFYLAATYRRLVNPEWDWQMTATGTWLKGRQVSEYREFPEDYQPWELGRVKSNLTFQTADFDAGYHPGANPLTRLHIGIRALHSSDKLTYWSPYDYWREWVDTEGWAIGPRIGFQSETMLGDSQFGFVAEASGSILLGRFKTEYGYQYDGQDEAYTESYSDTRAVYNLEALAGLSWHATESLTITAGYRAQKWWGLRNNTAFPASSNPSVSVDSDILLHGPFLRIGMTF